MAQYKHSLSQSHQGLAESPKKLFWLLVKVELILVLLDAVFAGPLLFDIGPAANLFNITREDGIASWFSSMQALLVALALLSVHQATVPLNKTRAYLISARPLKPWGLLAAFFAYLSLDDGSKLHERIGSTIEHFSVTNASADSLAHAVVSTYPSYSWQLLFVPIFAIIGILMLNFLWREIKNNKQRLQIFIAFLCYGLAVMIDFFEGIQNGIAPLAQYLNTDPGIVLHACQSLEEFLEMFGTSLFLLTFLQISNEITRITERKHVSI